MIRRLVISTALMAAAVGIGASSAPAAAQSAEDDARFEAAQQRLDSELAIFKEEFDRYQQAKSGGAARSQPGRRYEDPRVYGSDAGDEDPRMRDEGTRSEPEDRGEGDYEPR